MGVCSISLCSVVCSILGSFLVAWFLSICGGLGCSGVVVASVSSCVHGFVLSIGICGRVRVGLFVVYRECMGVLLRTRCVCVGW